MKKRYTSFGIYSVMLGCCFLSLSTKAQIQYRMVAATTYISNGSGGLAPSDSGRFYFPSTSTDIYDRYDSYSAFGSGTFSPRAKYLYTLDAQGRVKQVDVQNWNSTAGAFVASSREMDSLNTAGQQIYQLGQRWDATASVYVNTMRVFLVRNAANMILDQVNQNWVAASSSWVNDRHFKSEFNPQGGRTSNVYQRWKTATNTWRNTDSFSTVFDATGIMMTQQLNFSWDTTAGAWKAATRQFHSYDAAGNRTLIVAEMVDGSGNWVPTSKDTMTYTATNNPDIQIGKVWNAATSSFDNQTRTTNIYNAADLPIITTQERWVSGAWSLNTFGANKYFRYYEQFGNPSGIHGTQAMAPALQLSPNPASESLHLSLGLEKPESFTACVFDMNGRIVQTLSTPPAIQHSIDISTSGIPTGNYFIRIQTSGGHAISRMISVQH